VDNNYIDPVLREKELDGYRSIAQKIRNRLQQLENASDKDRKRWIWELLQNAVDAANDQEVDIEVILGNDFVKFRHNGGVFTPRNVTNLVHQISSKEGTNSIGRFGTGFLTTHTLSRIVEVEGVFIPSNIVNENRDNYYKFNLILDRTGKTEGELVEGIASAWDKYKREEIATPDLSFWTSFNYVNADIEVAKETIKDFETYICYSLAFVKKIRSVKIINEIENETVSFKFSEEETISDFIKTVTFQKTINENSIDIDILLVENESISLAIEIDNSKYNQTLILPIAENIPRLFCAYPLIGSEQFYFPFVINSIKFNPTQERDNLYLKGETYQSKPNKDLLLQATELYKIATNYVTAQKWKDLYILAKHQLPHENDEFDAKWYIDKIQNAIREQLLSIPIVENSFGNFLPIVKNEKYQNVAYFPYNPIFELREQIWKFAIDLFPIQIPKIQHIHDWYEILWNKEKGLQATIDNLTYQISIKQNLRTLKTQLKNKEFPEIEWLNTFVKFVEENQPELLDKYAILPNQYGDFKLKKELNKDNQIPNELKCILRDLGDDCFEDLLDLKITNVNIENAVWSIHSIVPKINAIIDRNEFFRLDDQIYDLLIKNGVDKKLVDNLKTIIRFKVFNNKQKLISKIKNIIGNEFSKIDIPQNSIFARKHIIALMSLISDNSDNNNYRINLYQIIKDFNNSTPSILTIPNLPETTWQKADIWILKHIISEIQSFKTIDKLCEHLKQNISKEIDNNKTLEWLNNFFIFLLENEKLELLSEKAVYPNQLGIFRKKSELFQDLNIPKQFKDILENLEKKQETIPNIVGWRPILLHKEIIAFDEKDKLNTKTVKEISEKINNLLSEIDFKDNEESQNILFSLIGYTKETNYEIQEKIWQILRAFYYDRIPEEILNLENSNDFDWNLCFLNCIEILLLDVTNCKYVEAIDSKLTGATTAIDWLHNLIDFLQKDEEYKSFLNDDEFAVLPNQNGVLCPKSKLYSDDGTIDEELKEILRYLQPEWIDELLDKKIYLDLQNRTRSFDDIANEIDKVFKDLSGIDKEKNEFKNAFKILYNWIEEPTNTEKLKCFDWTYRNRHELFMSTIGDRREKDAVLSLAASGNAQIFSDIAKNERYSKADFEFIANNPDKIRRLRENQNSKEELTTKQNVREEQLEYINKKTGMNFKNFETIIETLKNVDVFENEPEEGSPQTQVGHSKYVDIQAIKRANEQAHISIIEYLDNQPEYNIKNGITEISKTIYKTWKKGIEIYIVTKSANNGIVYLKDDEIQILKKTDKKILFSELWVYKNGGIYEINIGNILEKWNTKTIKAEMFDFKKS